jgi:hypothetical protein
MMKFTPPLHTSAQPIRDRWFLITSAPKYAEYLAGLPMTKTVSGVLDDYQDLQRPESFPCLVETHVFKPVDVRPGQVRRLIKRYHRFIYLSDAKVLLETAFRMKKAGAAVGPVGSTRPLF